MQSFIASARTGKLPSIFHAAKKEETGKTMILKSTHTEYVPGKTTQLYTSQDGSAISLMITR